MPSFLIESYKVRLELQRVGNPVVTHRNRIIEVVSVPLYHGIVERAMLNFSTYWDNWSGTPVVGFYSVANPYQPLLAGLVAVQRVLVLVRRPARRETADAVL